MADFPFQPWNVNAAFHDAVTEIAKLDINKRQFGQISKILNGCIVRKYYAWQAQAQKASLRMQKQAEKEVAKQLKKQKRGTKKN